MVKVLINGCNGKMGQEVANNIDNNENLLLIGGFDRENAGTCTFPVYTNFEQIEEKPDVIIDFSVPVATLNILDYASKENIAVVIATTGFTDEQNNIINNYSKKIPIFKSANMSFDINIMSKLVSKLAVLLKGTDIEIIETHHNRKIDSPSGTAKLLADSINTALGNTMEYEYNRHAKHEKRGKNEIGITSIRGGNIVGEHTVKFFGENETFEITHTSYSRSVFAEGALKAAEFIVEKPAGLYNMDNLINEE
jgi:4-hydroxy-tetrahydrodipicolinate reductase